MLNKMAKFNRNIEILHKIDPQSTQNDEIKRKNRLKSTKILKYSTKSIEINQNIQILDKIDLKMIKLNVKID